MVYYGFAGGFLGDIAVPLDEGADSTRFLKDRRFQEEVEKYKQEVLEGLQIEEEGLTDLFRKKTKQPAPTITPRNYNDPFDDLSTVNSLLHKSAQYLKLPYKSSASFNDTKKGTIEEVVHKRKKRHQHRNKRNR